MIKNFKIQKKMIKKFKIQKKIQNDKKNSKFKKKF